jgi:hypothetical protein
MQRFGKEFTSHERKQNFQGVMQTILEPDVNAHHPVA